MRCGRLLIGAALVIAAGTLSGCSSSIVISNESGSPMSYNYRKGGLEHSITLEPGQQLEIQGPTTVRFPPGAVVTVR